MIWQDLIQTCVLGTNRKQMDLEASAAGASGSLGVMLRRLDGPSEEKILMAVAATAVAIKAGQPTMRAADLPPPPAPCVETKDNQCSEYSITLLNHILNDQTKGGEGRKNKLLKDWLIFCHDGHKRIAPEYLPKLIEFAGSNAELHTLLSDCGGRHFQWLLDLNSEWRDIHRTAVADVSDIDELQEQVEIGLEEERITAFTLLRKIDPDRARDCIAALWEKEGTAQRMSFLILMADGLTMADEPFLEEVALNDKRKEVRTRAMLNLRLLPQSRLVARMEERAIKYLVKGVDGKIHIHLPEELDKEMARDGIEDGMVVDNRIGQKAGWVYQVLRFVDPSLWPIRFGMDTTRFFKYVLDSNEWSLPISLALIAATAIYKDPVWQDTIINCDQIYLTETNEGRLFLLSLPPAKLERLITMKLPNWTQMERRSAPRLDLWYYLELVDFKWSESFSLTIFRFITKEMRERVPIFGHTFYSNAANYGLRIHPSVGQYLNDINLAQQEIDTYTRNGLERFMDNLRLRHEMQKSFQDPSQNP